MFGFTDLCYFQGNSGFYQVETWLITTENSSICKEMSLPVTFVNFQLCLRVCVCVCV